MVKSVSFSNGFLVLSIAVSIIVIVIAIPILISILPYKHEANIKTNSNSTTRAQHTQYTSPGQYKKCVCVVMNVTLNGSLYRLAIKELEKMLEEAKGIYLNALKYNETYEIFPSTRYQNLSTKMPLLNTTIVNETTIRIGKELYRYVVFRLYNTNNKLGFYFAPKRISIDNIEVKLLPPRNTTVTSTAGPVFNYLIKYGNETCRVGLGIVYFDTYNSSLTGFTLNPCNNICIVDITTCKEPKSFSLVWLVLIKQ
ncbi:MAG: hypothetical protein LRS41_07060 [Caldisphaeraceae archaeon]|nr:hypothetical protein [Caldisphaeraceae archaeon]